MNPLRTAAVYCGLVLMLLTPLTVRAQVPPQPIPKPSAEPAAESPERLAELGQAAYKAGKFEQAFAYYQRAIKEISRTGFAKKEWLETFGELCTKLNKHDDFIDTMRQLVLLYPSKKPIAALRKFSNDLEPLMTAPDYSKKTKQFPPLRDETKKAFAAVKAALDAGDPAKAGSIAEAALINPNFNSYERATIWSLRGNIYFNQGNPVLGAYAFEQVTLQRDVPNEVLQKMNYLLGGTYSVIGRYDLAIDRLSKSLGPGLGPQEEWKAKGAICEAHAHLKHYAKAIESCEQLVTAASKQSLPLEDRLLRALSTVYFESGSPLNELRILKLLPDPTDAEQRRLAELEASIKKSR